jgi:hypothetical protein
MAAPPKTSPAEFDFLVRRAGLTMSEHQRADLYGAYLTLETLLERLRTNLPREAEPATIYVVDKAVI